jgi:hypothetical protein
MATATRSPTLSLALATCALVAAMLALARGPRQEPERSAAPAQTQARTVDPPPIAASQRSPAATSPAEDEVPTRERIEGMDGPIRWLDLLAAPGLGAWSSAMPACWRHDGGHLEGALMGGNGSVLLIGDDSWRDYECSLHVACEAGGEAEVRMRARDARHCYCVALLYGLQAVSVRLIDGDAPTRLLSCVDAALDPGRAYDLRLAARGESITTYLDGRLINQLSDATHRSGGMGVGVWLSRVRFDAPRVRFLDGCGWRPPIEPRAPEQAGF